MPPAPEPTTIELSALHLVIAAALVLIPATISIVLRLELERRLALAAVRTVTQLLLVGYVLRFVFAQDWFVVVLALAVLMIFVASRAAIGRPARTYRGVSWEAFGTLLLTGLLTTTIVTGVIIGARPWYLPRFFIPLLGMVLGNSLTGVSLCLDALLEALATRRAEIEMELSLGATRWEAAQPHIAAAVRRGMIPLINTMMVVGVVSLPGMMTGQILAGADPLLAVKYQIVVMFMIAAATSLGCIGIVLLAYRRLFSPDHRLLSERIS